MKTLNKHFIPKNLERCSLSVARCELTNLADCTSKGLTIAVSHIGGDTQNSVLTIHKIAADNSFAVLVMNIKINWCDLSAILQFKQAIVAARKIICEHNTLLKRSTCVLPVEQAMQGAN